MSIGGAGPPSFIDQIMDLGIDNGATEMHELGRHEDSQFDSYGGKIFR